MGLPAWSPSAHGTRGRRNGACRMPCRDQWGESSTRVERVQGRWAAVCLAAALMAACERNCHGQAPNAVYSTPCGLATRFTGMTGHGRLPSEYTSRQPSGPRGSPAQLPMNRAMVFLGCACITSERRRRRASRSIGYCSYSLAGST